MKVQFAKISVCDCGFPVLNESIPLGTLYEIDPNVQRTVTWICGGCKKVQTKLPVVWVEHKDGAKAGFLPTAIFEPPDAYATAV